LPLSREILGPPTVAIKENWIQQFASQVLNDSNEESGKVSRGRLHPQISART